jgi:excisionase family DNA binding protein
MSTNTSQLAPAREWLDLKALREYACISERTLREWIHLPTNPLPASRVGTKLLIRRSTFDHWLESYRLKPANLSTIVDEVLSSVCGGN